jgi:hypothetical protein
MGADESVTGKIVGLQIYMVNRILPAEKIKNNEVAYNNILFSYINPNTNELEFNLDERINTQREFIRSGRARSG